MIGTNQLLGDINRSIISFGFDLDRRAIPEIRGRQKYIDAIMRVDDRFCEEAEHSLSEAFGIRARDREGPERGSFPFVRLDPGDLITEFVEAFARVGIRTKESDGCCSLRLRKKEPDGSRERCPHWSDLTEMFRGMEENDRETHVQRDATVQWEWNCHGEVFCCFIGDPMCRRFDGLCLAILRHIPSEFWRGPREKTDCSSIESLCANFGFVNRTISE